MMFGGKLFLIRSIKVSAVVTFLFSPASSSTPSTLPSPGLMVTTRMMPRMTARMVVEK